MPNSKPSEVPIERLRLIAESFHRLTGKPLFAEIALGDAVLRDAMWSAPFAIVAHGTESDPIFFYGNRYALQHFGMSFEEFTSLPSRLSAEPLAQQAREALLENVTRQGFVTGYSGTRTAKDGRRFLIRDCTVWNLIDAAGEYGGQAAVFMVQD